jgi:hypothetical protein
LTHSKEFCQVKPSIGTIFEATKSGGVIFLATPHRGSGPEGWTGILVKLAAILGTRPSESAIDEMRNNSEVLNRIGRSFSLLLKLSEVKIASFAEGLPMPKGFGKVYIPSAHCLS